jgi:hypothetical protein
VPPHNRIDIGPVRAVFKTLDDALDGTYADAETLRQPFFTFQLATLPEMNNRLNRFGPKTSTTDAVHVDARRGPLCFGDGDPMRGSEPRFGGVIQNELLGNAEDSESGRLLVLGPFLKMRVGNSAEKFFENGIDAARLRNAFDANVVNRGLALSIGTLSARGPGTFCQSSGNNKNAAHGWSSCRVA